MSKGPEEALQSKVLALAKLYGWQRHHQRAGYQPGTQRWISAISGEPGYPDLVLVRGNRLIFAELKSDKGRLSPGQKEWIALLQGIPSIEVYVWRPKDWDEIEATLKR